MLRPPHWRPLPFELSPTAAYSFSLTALLPRLAAHSGSFVACNAARSSHVVVHVPAWLRARALPSWLRPSSTMGRATATCSAAGTCAVPSPSAEDALAGESNGSDSEEADGAGEAALLALNWTLAAGAPSVREVETVQGLALELAFSLPAPPAPSSSSSSGGWDVHWHWLPATIATLSPSATQTPLVVQRFVSGLGGLRGALNIDVISEHNDGGVDFAYVDAVPCVFFSLPLSSMRGSFPSVRHLCLRSVSRSSPFFLRPLSVG